MRRKGIIPEIIKKIFTRAGRSKNSGKGGTLFRSLLGPLAGALIGAAGGIAGMLIGLLMGFLVRELLRQSDRERAIVRYLENPGPSDFTEGEPGMAAYCALGILILAHSTAKEPNRIRNAEDAIQEPALTSAAEVFPHSGTAELETYCRLAASRITLLNEDLLAESLAARRAPYRDLPRLGKSLARLGFGPGIGEAAYIHSILDPLYQDENGSPEKKPAGTGGSDPWKVLGLEPGAPPEKIKSAYRRLAVQFHPDALQALDEKRQAEAARAFITIQEAYQTS
jgi:DnaJ like chaperone protein